MSPVDPAIPAGQIVDIERYAPRIALQWLLRDSRARHQRVAGTLGFFDLSGFTRLSERLGRAGKIGVENVNAVVDRLYSGIIDPAHRNGGDVLQFSGDAILVLFTGPGHEARAAAAAIGMQRFLARDGRVETEMGAVRLKMSVGMHSGEFELVLLGTEHRFLLAFGPGVSRVCQYEKDAEPGEVLCSPELGRGLPAAAIGIETRNGFLLNRRARIEVDAVAPVTPLAPELARTFLFSDLRDKLADARTTGGHRSITAAFIGVRGVDAIVAERGAAAAADTLHAFSRVVEDAVSEFDVTWTTTDALIDGCHFMLTSQLLRTHEDDNDRMLLLARRVVEAADNLRVAVGVNYGRVFIGDAGHPARRVFTGFGDAINAAARVMNHAPDGVVLATPVVLDRTQVPFATTPMPPFKAKGKSAPVEISAVASPTGGRRATRDGVGTVATFIGRTEAVATLESAVTRLQSGTGGVVEIAGEAGLGKTRLVAEHRWSGDVDWWTATAEPYARATPYGAFRPLLREMIDAGVEPDRRQAGIALGNWVAKHAPELEPWLPLIAIVADAEVAPTPEATRLDPEFVRARLHASVATVLHKVAGSGAVVVVEDAHWLDDASFELMQYLADPARRGPVLWIITRRPALASLAIDDAQTIALQPLTPEETRALAIEVATGLSLPTDTLERVVSRSGGNPLFASELAMTAPFTDELPESVEQVAAARIDTLAIAHRMLLRDASVLGTVVDVDLLSQVRGESCPDEDPRWSQLADYLERTGAGEFRFRHELLRVAAYEGMAYRRRRELHSRTGDLLEERAAPGDRDQVAAVLALHYHAAQRFDRSWDWSRRAARDAEGKSAFYEAAGHFNQALDAARKLDIDAATKAETAESLGDVNERLGRLDEARVAFIQARKFVPDDAAAVARAYGKTAKVEIEQGRYTQALRTVARGLKVLDTHDAAKDESAADTERARLLLVASGSRYYQGRLADATRLCESAIAVAEHVDDKRARAQAHLQLATFYISVGDTRAERHENAAMALFTELGDDIGLGKLLTNMGITALDFDFDVALERFAQSAEAFERAGNEVAAWTAHSNRSELLSSQGHYAEARAILVEARRVFSAAGQRFDAALAASGLSRIELYEGNIDEAGTLNDLAIEMCIETGMRPYELDSQVRRVEWLVFAGRPDAALALSDSLAVDIAHEETLTGPIGSLPVTLRRFRSWALLAQGRLEEARQESDAVVAQARASSLFFEEAMAHYTAACIDDAAGADPSEARAAADRIFDRLHVVSVPTLPVGIDLLTPRPRAGTPTALPR